ncbi:LpqB family beta-propeller domain-containing protein [Streptomyces sp. NPDC020607]|uniref:LpqB family beta-propeller domain-containing protein n=1 Tax=Streptomyces sp. NPDC020607 TaxID=3365082 RepID=UPI0037AB3069
MGTEHAGRGRLVIRRTMVFGCGAALLAGCASIPSSGAPEAVDAVPGKPQVQVFATPPRDNATPGQIIDGFIEALTSNDPDFSIASEYLTEKAAKAWDPESSTTILADGPKTSTKSLALEQDAKSYTYELSGSPVATIDADHAYQPALQAPRYEADVQLVKEGPKDKEQWRIATPPEGVVLGELDFIRLYKHVDRYYYATNASRGDAEHPQSPPLVADPVYVRGDPDPQLTDVLEALFDGPTAWLDRAVYSSFPSGMALRKGTKELTPDDQKHLRVPLNVKADNINQDRCKQMAAQIYFTLENLALPSGLEQVDLLRSDGESSLCVLGADEAKTIAPRPAGKPESQYFIDKEHRLVQIPENGMGISRVPGELGEGKQELRSAAVSRNEQWAAGVSGDGRSLFVGALREGAKSERAKVTSTATKEKNRLAPPSWDGRGDLWVADLNPKKPRLLWLDKGQGEPVEVKFDRPLGADGEGRIKAVRVAADGVRIALLIEDGGKTELMVGRIDRPASEDGEPGLTVGELQPAAPKMEEVTAMSWAGGSRLLVVGKAAGGVWQMRFVYSDGSLVSDEPTLPGLTGVTEVSAAESPQLPLIARSRDGIVRRAEGEDWKPVDKDGTAPVYPG